MNPPPFFPSKLQFQQTISKITSKYWQVQLNECPVTSNEGTNVLSEMTSCYQRKSSDQVLWSTVAVKSNKENMGFLQYTLERVTVIKTLLDALFFMLLKCQGLLIKLFGQNRSMCKKNRYMLFLKKIKI